MIAQFHFMLPVPLSVRGSDVLEPWSIEHKGEQYRVFPPYQMPASGDVAGPVLDTLTVEGQATYLANVLRIEVSGEFDRREASPVRAPEVGALEVARRVVSLFRSLSRAPFVLLPDEHCAWRLRYLNDDGTELEAAAGLVRGRGTSVTTGLARSWIAPELWSALPEKILEPSPPSDELLLDAANIWPHVGASVVLAAAAIEVRVATALDLLAARSPQAIGPGFWAWVNDRGNFLKEPSVEEQLTNMLDIISGRSLKRESTLWNAYCDLRKARNSFVHEGQARLLNGATVTPEKASELISHAQAIVDWIEMGLLPTERRPTVTLPPRTIQMMIPIFVGG